MFNLWEPVVSGSAYSACCVEDSDVVIVDWCEAYLMCDVLWMPCKMCVIVELPLKDGA